MSTGSKTKKRIIATVVILAVILLSAGGVYAAVTWQKIKYDPMSLFNNQTASPKPTENSPTPAKTETAASTTAAEQSSSPASTTAPAPTDTLSPEDVLKGEEDPSILKDTLNVLLIGTDYADERITDPHYARSGKDDFNSDVMIVLAINFKQKKVDMISCQRDTYAYVYNAAGICKLNGSLSRGGGLDDKGYKNVCKSVQYLLDDKGRIPIDYYIAGSIPAVKELTDMVGGVDFNVDINFKIDGRAYKKGPQHLTGQGVLDYSRVRKNSGTGYISGPQGDLARTGRQRAILMAVFEKLKNNADWLNAPSYLMQMQGKVSTNLSVPQLAALTLFAKDLPMKNITTRVMPGVGGSSHAGDETFGWTFVLIDQSKRVQMIRDIYGINVSPEYKYDKNYAKLLWAYIEGDVWEKAIKDTLTKDANLMDKKKLTDTAQLTQLNDLLTQVQGVMQKYKSKLYDSSKPVVSSDEVTELQTAVYSLHNPSFNSKNPATFTLADEMFFLAGYKIQWTSLARSRIPPQNK